MIEKDLFAQLPDELFRPLASPRQRLYWRVLVRLYQTLFEEEYGDSEYGHARTLVINTIETVLNQYTGLWVDDPEDEDSGGDIRLRANLVYNKLRQCGWMEQDRRAYHDYVTMPPRVSQCLAALIELSEGRALVMTGALKNMRATIREIQAKPEGQADRLVELAKDAARFSRHLNSIRGAIKGLYDRIRGDLPARDIVNAFFDDFLREIFVRDYTTIKTTDNPLAIRDELLAVLAGLRYQPDKQQVLLAGYQALYPGAADHARAHLDQDLSRLEQVFLNIERQLDGIDAMKVRYEKRVDTVIDYATRTTRPIGKDLARVIDALSSRGLQFPDLPVRVPLQHPEGVGESRFQAPRRFRPPPQPSVLRERVLSAGVKERLALERAARQAIQIDDKGLLAFLETQMGQRHSVQLPDLIIHSVRDYFCVLNVLRAARFQAGARRLFPKFSRYYDITGTDQWVETDYIKARNIVISKRI